MDFKYNGIILNKFDIGETDRIYGIYTFEVGKIRAKAVGVRKPNAKLAGSLEPLTQAEIFMARGRGRGNITGVIATNNFLGIKSDIHVLEKVFYAFGIFSRMVTDEEKDEKIFELLIKYLGLMDTLASGGKNMKMDIVTAGFLIKLLDEMGYGIEVDKCVKCRGKLKPHGNFFSPEQGGILCENCGKSLLRKIKIGHNSIKIIRLFLANKIDNFSKIEAEEKTIRNLKSVISEEINWITA